MKETGYLLQAALICTWWVGLATSQQFFDAFQYLDINSTAFWSFLAPDLLLIALLSVIRAYFSIVMLEHIILGAFGYGTLYCCNAAIITGSGLLPTGLMLLGLGFNLFLCFSDAFFRSSRSTGFWFNASKTMVQVICIWFVALVAVPYVLLFSFDALDPPALGISLWLGGILFLVFSTLGLTSAYFMVRDGCGTPLPMDQTNNLVISGPYAWVRNPMAIAGIGQGIAISIIFQSVPIVTYSILGGVVWHLVVRPIEERDLSNRFGESFEAYRARVRCWVPRRGHKAE